MSGKTPAATRRLGSFLERLYLSMASLYSLELHARKFW